MLKYAIFATQEVVAKYLRGGSHVYMCLYDLQKAFDSVENPVLLEKLFYARINGKLWRLMQRAGMMRDPASSSWLPTC